MCYNNLKPPPRGVIDASLRAKFKMHNAFNITDIRFLKKKGIRSIGAPTREFFHNFFVSDYFRTSFSENNVGWK